MQSTTTEHRPGRAIALKLGAVFLFSVMAALIKIATATVPAAQAVFYRSFFAFPMIILWLWQSGDLRDGLKPSNLMGHVWRGVFGTTAMALTFAGLSLLPLPEVTAIGYATPLFTVIFAAIFLGEQVRVFRLSAVAVGLIGVLIVLYPRFTVGGDSVSQLAMHRLRKLFDWLCPEASGSARAIRPERKPFSHAYAVASATCPALFAQINRNPRAQPRPRGGGEPPDGAGEGKEPGEVAADRTRGRLTLRR